MKPSSTDCESFTDTMLGVRFELNKLSVGDDSGPLPSVVLNTTSTQ